jgi:hypothetical protein
VTGAIDWVLMTGGVLRDPLLGDAVAQHDAEIILQGLKGPTSRAKSAREVGHPAA